NVTRLRFSLAVCHRYTCPAVLGRLAHAAHTKRRRRIPMAFFYDASLAAAPGVFPLGGQSEREASMDLLLNEMLVDGLLQRFHDTIEFSHLSFQEYLIANQLSQTVFAAEAEIGRAHV